VAGVELDNNTAKPVEFSKNCSKTRSTAKTVAGVELNNNTAMQHKANGVNGEETTTTTPKKTTTGESLEPS
jgi:hypothetical protein